MLLNLLPSELQEISYILQSPVLCYSNPCQVDYFFSPLSRVHIFFLQLYVMYITEEVISVVLTFLMEDPGLGAFWGEASKLSFGFSTD